MQALSVSNELSVQPLCSLCLCGYRLLLNHHRDTENTEVAQRRRGNLPMINQKKSSELIETSLIYLLSAAVAVGAFGLVWLISLLLGSSQT